MEIFPTKSNLAITNSSDSKDNNYWERSKFNITAILPAYFLILAICLVGNSLVCLTVWRNKNMRNRWYSLLVNLSVADMGLALCTPIQLFQFVNIDIGEIGCKSSIFVLDIFFGTAMLILAYISLDRYHGICKPPLKLGEERVRAVVIIPSIWLAVGITYAPMLFVCGRSTKVGNIGCDCHSSWPKEEHYTAYAFFIVFVTYLMPFSTMLICYCKICRKLWSKSEENSMIPSDPTGSKKRSIKMLILTTSLFFFCWTPYNCLYVLKKLKLVNAKTLGKIWLFSQVLGFANSAWNPFTYCIFSKNFRKGFKAVFFWLNRKQRSSNISSKTTPVSKGSRSRTLTDTGYGSSVLVDSSVAQSTPVP